MGFWDVRLADLEAAGETFSEEEVEALENGGLILHLHPLENADVEVNELEMAAGNQVVLVPEVIQAYAPTAQVLSAWAGQQTDITLREYLDANHYSEQGTWTWAPAYCGTVTAGTLGQVLATCREDEMTPYVYWNCIPLTSVAMADAAETLIAAAGRMLDDAGYWQMQSLCHISYNYYNPHDAWLWAYHREFLTAEDISQLFTEIDYFSGAHTISEIEDELRITGGDFQYLYERFALDAEVPDLMHHSQSTLPWKPLGTYLEEDGSWDALDLLNRVLARRRAGIARMPPLRTVYGFNFYEGAA